MKPGQKRGYIRSKENAGKVFPVLLAWFILCGLYCGLLLIEGAFVGGDMYKSINTLIAGSALAASTLLIYLIFPHPYVIAPFACIATQIVFLTVGSYLHELEFYFFVMFLLVGVFSMLKDFKLLAICVSLMVLIDAVFLLFYVPLLDWLDHYRFFMKFCMFIYGAAFLLIQTYNVTRKESNADRALTSFSSLLRSTPNLMAITGTDSRVLYLSDKMEYQF